MFVSSDSVCVSPAMTLVNWLMLGFLGMQRGQGYVSQCCSINELCSFVAAGVHNHLDRVGIESRMCPCTYYTCVLLGLVLPFPLVS